MKRPTTTLLAAMLVSAELVSPARTIRAVGLSFDRATRRLVSRTAERLA